MKDKLVEPHDRYYGPDHHIWNNNGTWWCHLSLFRKRGPAKRIRFSLHTLNRRSSPGSNLYGITNLSATHAV